VSAGSEAYVRPGSPAISLHPGDQSLVTLVPTADATVVVVVVVVVLVVVGELVDVVVVFGGATVVVVVST
jgi:hypothetical protein